MTPAFSLTKGLEKEPLISASTAHRHPKHKFKSFLATSEFRTLEHCDRVEQTNIYIYINLRLFPFAARFSDLRKIKWDSRRAGGEEGGGGGGGRGKAKFSPSF